MASVTCEWFALCANQTSQAADHPILGPVPICERCATKLGVIPTHDITTEEKS